MLLSIALDLDANSPLSALFVSVLMENLALPSQEVMLKLNIQLVKYASDRTPVADTGGFIMFC